MRGWCFDEAGRPIRGVRARVGPRVIRGLAGWDRPDVRLAFGTPPAGGQSGFGIVLFLLPGHHRVALEADVEGVGWTEFRRLEFTAPWGDFARRWWRRAAFRIAGFFDLTGALGRLTQPELEWAYAEQEQRGRMPLRLSPHHPPRPVQGESFPAPAAGGPPLPRCVIVTPSYQQAHFLEATLTSVLDQPGVDLAYAVMDGGSTDGTRELLARYAPRLAACRSERDEGQGDAIRKGFAAIPGRPDDVMAYLNSDDLLMPGALRFVAEHFARHPDVDVVYGHRVIVDEAGAEVGRWLTPRMALDDLSWFDLIPQETLFWRRRLWDRIGGIDPSFKFALDWDLLLRLRQAGAKFSRLPFFLGQFRIHSLQKSQALLHEHGIPEMDKLRLRAFGKAPPQHEMSWRMLRAQIDSARLAERMKQGWRS